MFSYTVDSYNNLPLPAVDFRQIIQDVDEFIVPKKFKTIPKLLDTKDDPTNGKQF